MTVDNCALALCTGKCQATVALTSGQAPSVRTIAHTMKSMDARAASVHPLFASVTLGFGR